MCPIVEEIQNDFETITTYNVENNKTEIEQIAERILNYYVDLNENIDIVSVTKAMGFSVLKSTFKNPHVEGCISINDKNIEIYQNNKIIKVSSKEPFFKKRFIITHELGHYLFEFRDNNENTRFLSASYNFKNPEDEEAKRKEDRANYFAACILMPRTRFIAKYNELLENYKNYSLVQQLSEYFETPLKSVEMRIKELNLNLIQENTDNE